MGDAACLFLNRCYGARACRGAACSVAIFERLGVDGSMPSAPQPVRRELQSKDITAGRHQFEARQVVVRDGLEPPTLSL